MEQQINKLRYFSFAVLSIAIAASVIVVVFAPINTAIILLVLIWLSASIIMSWFRYKIKNLRENNLQIYVAPATYPQPVYSQPVYSSQPSVYSSQPLDYSEQTIYKTN